MMCYTPMVKIGREHVLWKFLIMTQLVLLHRCQDLHSSDSSLFCQQHLDVTSESSPQQKLTDVVGQPDFCPWKDECSGSCDGRCRKPLGFSKTYCTSTNDTDLYRCPNGQCICSDPKPACFEMSSCPCINSEEGEKECCVYAIYCLMGSSDSPLAYKLCFIPLDDPAQEVRCLHLGIFCKTLESYFCDASCLTSVSSVTIEPTDNATISDPGVSNPALSRLHMVYYIVAPLLALLIVIAAIITIICIRKKKRSRKAEEVIDGVDRYTTVDHPQRSVNPADTRDSNIDNPMYDMQILGESTSNHSGSRPSSPTRPTGFSNNTRSYENISPSPSIPSSPTSEQAKLLPGSKTSTGSTSPNQLAVPVFNALQNRQRGTRSRVTFLPRTPSPQPERKVFPGTSEEYEAIVPSSPSDTGSPCPSTSDDRIPLVQMNKKAIDSGYENATLLPNNKLKTRTSDSGYENTNLADQENSNEIYDYADVVFDPDPSKTNSASQNRSLKASSDPVEYATPEVNKVEYAIPEVKKVGYNQLKPINRHLDMPPAGNQYNKLNCSSRVTPQAEEGGEYSKLRREGSDIAQTKPTLKSLPDVIRVGQKPH